MAPRRRSLHALRTWAVEVNVRPNENVGSAPSTQTLDSAIRICRGAILSRGRSRICSFVTPYASQPQILSCLSDVFRTSGQVRQGPQWRTQMELFGIDVCVGPITCSRVSSVPGWGGGGDRFWHVPSSEGASRSESTMRFCFFFFAPSTFFPVACFFCHSPFCFSLFSSRISYTCIVTHFALSLNVYS